MGEADVAVNPNYNPAPSALPQIRPTPRVVLGYHMHVCIQHFADPNNIQEPSLKGFTWAPDDRVNEKINSKILIDPITKFDPAHMMSRPAIILARGDLSHNRHLIGDNVMAVQATLGEVDPNVYPIAGQSVRSGMRSGELTLFCIHKDGAAAELLGEEVDALMGALGGDIRNELHLHDWALLKVGSPGRLEEVKEHWTVPIVIGFSYWVEHLRRSYAPLLKRINPTIAID